MSKEREALKLALGALMEATKIHASSCKCSVCRAVIVAQDALAEQPAQQEPVPGYQISMKSGAASSAWIDVDESVYNSAKMYGEYKCRVFYTSPQPSKPLTDEQWQAISDTLGCLITRSQKDVIEQAHGITGEQK